MSGKTEDYAGRVFLLMGKEYRISRSIRAQWFFQHINSTVYSKSDEELVSSREELEVLSVLPEVSHIHGVESFRLAPSTKITFIGRQYRFVFCLDISPSEATVNVETGKMLMEEIFCSFMNCIMGLVERFTVPGSSLVLQPELVITVLAHTPLAYKTCQVIVQGFCVTQGNLYDLLYEVKSKLQTLEDYMANEIIKKNKRKLLSEAEIGDGEEVILHEPESGLFMMVRDALLALQLLPDNASAGLIIVTDGVFSLSDASVVDSVLAQMRASTVVCSFLQVGSGSQYAANGFGYIPHTSLMQFIASATSGAYLCSCPKVNTTDINTSQTSNTEVNEAQPMNIYHDALLCWNFHTDADREKIESKDALDKLWIKRLPFSKANTMKSSVQQQTMQKIKHTETNLQTRIASVLSVRLREGYSIENVAITKDGTQLEVTLTLPWKENVLIEYIAKAAWPLEQINRSTHVDVFIGGSYDFLVDITSKQKFTSSYRKTVVFKFDQTMKSLLSTDELLVRLQLFSINPAYTTIPDSFKDGVPLFHLPQNSKTPVLSLQHGRSKKSAKSQEAQFAEFWKPILHLDTKTWQKWFHCHRISILLENDRPISKSLFLQSSSGHYQSVHCRTALNTLNRMLRDWSSFVLLENHSYIRFLGRSTQRTPYSFCLLRLVFKGLCVVIRLAFLGGTAGTERHKIVSELKNSLRAMKAPLKKPLFSPEHTLADSPPKSVILTTKEKHCVLMLEKPLERILIKYDNLPEELRFTETKGSEGEGILDTTQSSSRLTPVAAVGAGTAARSTAVLGALSCYMYNQRWIWNMSCQGNSLPNSAVAGVLYALTKRRLLEGFHFCSSANGIITMVKEVSMKRSVSKTDLSEDVCVIQFVLFPPHHTLQVKEGNNEESVEGDPFKDTKGDLQIATEIWIEPQSGNVHTNEAGLQHFDGLSYNEIPKEIFGTDFDTVKDLVTYAHLESMCNDSLLVSVPSSPAVEVQPPSDWFSASSVVEVPFLFDVISLLRKSRQIFMLLPLLRNVELDETIQEQGPNDILLSLLFSSLKELNDCEVPLRDEDCAAFSEFVQQRSAKQQQDSGTNEIPSISYAENSQMPLWKCFTGCTRSMLFIIFVPASVDDAEKIVLDDDGRKGGEEDEGTVADVQTSSSEVRNDSEPKKSEKLDETVDPNSQSSSQQFLPVFLYECKFSVISDIKSQEQEFQNIFLDYSSKLTETMPPSDVKKQDSTDETIREIEKSPSLSAYCKSLTERYFQTFVNGVFSNLQLGYSLCSKDVESSVEMICEEAHLEVDITRFIRIICMHYRNETIDDEVFGCPSEGNVVIRRGARHSSTSTLRSPRTTSSSTVRCRSESIHRFVQDSFTEILRKKFTPVPQNTELFFYQSDEDQAEKEELASISEAESEIDESEIQGIDEIYESAAQFAEIRDASHENTEFSEDMSDLSRISVKGSTCAVSELESAKLLSDVGSSIDSESDDFSHPQPLFLHLTCSLRNRNQVSDMTVIPVNSLPTCLGEIIALLENGSNFDPCSSSLRVSLDLNCLILPPEMESPKHWKVSEGVALHYAESDIDEDFLAEDARGLAEDQMRQGVFEFRDEKAVISPKQGENVSTFIENAVTDPLKNLPKSQLNAIKVIVKRIEWLLKDEIASALRNTYPITEITLDNVADHVKNSYTDNCQFRQIPLRFVCGIDKSQQLFLDELIQARIDCYHLENQGKYYYLVSDKSSGSPKVDSRVNADGLEGENAQEMVKEEISEDYEFEDRIEGDGEEAKQVDKEIVSAPDASQRLVQNTSPLADLTPDGQTDNIAENLSPTEQNVDKKSTDNLTDISTEQSVNQSLVTTTEPSENKSVEYSADPSVEMTSNKTVDGSVEQTLDQSELEQTKEGSESTISKNAGQEFDKVDEPEQEPEDISGETVLTLCESILQDILDHALPRHVEYADIDYCRSRKGSLPLPDRDDSFIRRRYSDPGLSRAMDRTMSIKLEDLSTESKQLTLDDNLSKSDPDFWLFARIIGNAVMVFFHKRRGGNESKGLQSEQCYIKLLSIIDNIGRVVNQRMLLDDLNETFTCHNLLVAEEDEQIWSRRETKPLFVSGTSEMGMPFEYSKVVHGEFEFKPGYFECDKVWETYLPIHYRLKRSPGQPKGTSRAMQAVRSVLDRFAVSNRSNLFVYRESSGNVFYFRINEESETVPPMSAIRSNEDDQLKDDNFSYHSAASSSWSLAGKVQPEACSEHQEENEIKDSTETKLHRTNSLLTQTEKDSVSELSFAGSSIISVQKIHFCVHGICDPGSEIKDELVRVLANKLDDAVFEQLNLLIARNPKCRLAPADVQFIQPAGQPPASVICIALSKSALPYVHPLLFYLRQNLLQRFHTPRFTETNPEFHFKNYTGKASNFASAEALSLNDVYLYNRREKKGNGIGCIHLSLINCDDKEVIVDSAYHKVRTEIWDPKLYINHLKDLITVQHALELKSSHPDHEVFLKFKVWERGSIGIDELRSFLLSDVRRALCDVFIEYFVLATPISEVPAHLLFHYASRAASAGSTTTPPIAKNPSGSTTPVSSTPFPYAARPFSKFLSEPATPAERRSRSPGILLRNRSLNEFSAREPLSRKSSRESPRDLVKKHQQEAAENLEKTYETLEEFFPLNKPGSSHVESPAPRKSDSDNASVKDSDAASSETESISVVNTSRNTSKILPEHLSPDDHPPLGSSYDTLTDREVEESFNATLHTGNDETGNAEKKELTWQEIEQRRRKDKDAKKLRRKYERGEIGSLHPCFHSGIDDVLDEVINERSLSIHRHSGSLKCRYTPELLMKEILKLFSDIFPNAKAKVFKQVSLSTMSQYDEKAASPFVPYNFERNAVKSDDQLESSTDNQSTGRPASLVPGCDVSFIAVGRNMKQWRKSVCCNEVISDEEEKSLGSSGISKQQFKPLSSDGTSPGSNSADSLAPSYIKIAFIPRQKFYIVKFASKEIVTYCYNFPAEMNALLDKQLTRLYAWFNARMHFTSCMSMQKLGLFHHLHFTKEKHADEETTSFCSSTNHSHITSLTKETSPPSRERNKSVSSDISKSLVSQMPGLDETLRDTAPLHSLHTSGYKTVTDPVKRVGYQYQEITKVKINLASQRAKLKEILDMWHNCGPHIKVYENRLQLLKRYSHFIHFCQTPLLFNTCSKNKQTEQPADAEKDKEAKTEDISNTSPNRASRMNFDEASHDWYGELKWTVMQKYIQYLQTLGFCAVPVQPNAKSQQSKSQKSGFKRVPSKLVNEGSAKSRPNVHYMQKSVNAGIMLLEISYRGDNLFLKMFAFEASRLKTLDRFVTIQENWLFLEDCMKYRDLLHIHSFSYDLHLRQAQQFLSGRNMIFYPGYPVQKLLQSLMNEFPKPPAFSCCYLAQGTVSIPCSSELETIEVYKYLTINAERYRMNPAKITKIEDTEIKTNESIDQTILSYMYYTSRSQDKSEFQKMASSFRRDSADFDGNVVITLSPSQDKEVLNLTFFLVLTNRREFYPRRTLKGKLSSLRNRKRTLSTSPKGVGMSESDESQISGPTKHRVRFSTRTSSNSCSEDQYQDEPQPGPLKVPTWPGSLHKNESTSPSKEISSPNSDTALLTAKKLPNYMPSEQARLFQSSSDELFIRRSNSNDSIPTSASTTVSLGFRKSSSSGQLSASAEVADVNFLANEVAFVSKRLTKVASTCLSNCWRDFVWYQLLLMDCIEEDTSARKQRKRVETRKESLTESAVHNWKLEKTLRSIRRITSAKISHSEMKLLLGLVKVYSISEIDKNMATIFTLMGNSRPQKNGTLKVLSGKFGNSYREFLSEELRIRYVCILNPKDLDMFVLVITDLDGTIQDIKAVYREEPPVPPTSVLKYTELPERGKADMEHIENVISCVSYNIWTQILPYQ